MTGMATRIPIDHGLPMHCAGRFSSPETGDSSLRSIFKSEDNMPSDIRLFMLFLCICLIVTSTLTMQHANAAPESESGRTWIPVTEDDLHDPANPALKFLHNPGELLSKLPQDGSGNQVNWDKALEEAYITPTSGMHASVQPEVLNLDVLMKKTGEMPLVNFPHRQHTEWLSCNDCHDRMFKAKAGATQFSMFDILNGEYCGRCHGAVAFPLTECERCHNVPRKAVDSHFNKTE